MTESCSSLSNHFKIIDDEAGFLRAIRALRVEPRIGLDLESNGFFRYPERICLVQVSTPAEVFLIDPLAIEDLAPLGEVLADADVETILHAGGNDVVSLDRDWRFRIESLFDTSIAAAFVGMSRLGLASVVSEALSVTLSKSKKLQRSDWTKRPLSQEALTYAADDVHHLHVLRDTLHQRLRDLNRVDWVTEECQRLAGMRYEPSDPELAVFNVKGWRGLDDRGLAILKELVDYRERLALRMDRTHFRVMPDMALMTLAAKPSSNLRSVRGLGGRFARGSFAAGLRDAISRGKSAEPPRRPSGKRSRLSSRDRAETDRRLSRLKAWRIAEGEKLHLDPALLWPMKSLQRLARHPEDIDIEMDAPEVRRWQRSEFEKSLREVLG